MHPARPLLAKFYEVPGDGGDPRPAHVRAGLAEHVFSLCSYGGCSGTLRCLPPECVLSGHEYKKEAVAVRFLTISSSTSNNSNSSSLLSGALLLHLLLPFRLNPLENMKFSVILLALVAAPLAVLGSPVPDHAAPAAPAAPSAAQDAVPTADFGFHGFPAARPPARGPVGPAGPPNRGFPAGRPPARGPTGPAGPPTRAPGAGQGVPTAQQLIAAANAWRADTGKVSAFLNTAPTMSGTALLRAAAAANVAEKDELTHKAVIDRHPISKTAAVQRANNMLVTQGHFQAVVDALTNFPAQGGQAAATRININRCPNVLPAIDAYLRAASAAAGGGVANPAAIRPTACGGPA
ncbi:hypothetical protein HDU88_002527 [Geranomyces variabilis]|nr:hypothetical protein HDU88_002527 [Geranomyces variabilis]